MICKVCNKEGARIRNINRSYGEGDELMVVEHIPAVFCPNCGESYFTAATMDQIDHALSEKERRITSRRVPVVSLAE